MDAHQILKVFLDGFVGSACDTEFVQEQFGYYIKSHPYPEQVSELFKKWGGDDIPGANWLEILKTLITHEMDLTTVYYKIAKMMYNHPRYSTDRLFCGKCIREMLDYLYENGANPGRTLGWIINEASHSAFTEDFVFKIYVWGFLLDIMEPYILSKPETLKHLLLIDDWNKVKPVYWEDNIFSENKSTDMRMVFLEQLKECSDVLKKLFPN